MKCSIEQPSDLRVCAQVWTNYKHHFTIKFLIGITSQGTISYLSCYTGGRILDKMIVEQSDLIKYLLPGDIVIADRGFTCDDYACMAYAEVKIPPFTKGKNVGKGPNWLEPRAVCSLYSCRASHRVIKQMYTIQQNVLPISFIGNKDDIGNATVDKLEYVIVW